MAKIIIGLDLGSSAVRAVQVTAGRGGAGIDRLGQISLPHGAVRDGEIVEPAVVVEALTELWSRFSFSGRRVALGVANQQVVVRQLDLPLMPEAELRRSLQFQVADAIPIPVDQAILDYHVLGPVVNEQGEPLIRLLLVAAQRQMVESVLDVVRRARLEPVALDLDAFAVLRSLAPRGHSAEPDGELLLDVGAAVTNIVVHQGGAPRFVRILLQGGNSVTESLVDGLGLSFADAEVAKSRPVVQDEYSFGEEDQHARLVAEQAQRFADEIRGSLDYYSAQPEAVRVGRVVLSGGASLLPLLRDRLADTLGLPVAWGDPLAALQPAKLTLAPEQLDSARPFLAVAVGLAQGVAA